MSAERQVVPLVFLPCKRHPPPFLMQRLGQLKGKGIPFQVIESADVPEHYRTPSDYPSFSYMVSLFYRGEDGSLLHVFTLHNKDHSAQWIRSEGWCKGQGLDVLFLRRPTGWVKKVLSACHSSTTTWDGYPKEA